MESDGARHVFVSYVREDSAEVDRLCAALAAAGVPYWKDREQLGPGDDWKQAIRDAIRNDAFAFVPCFSRAYAAREKSHMNEELTLAVEEYRLRQPGRPWIFPVRFDETAVPSRDLGGGRLLGDLNWADLHGDVYTTEMVKLIQRIQALFGGVSSGPRAAAAAIRDIGDEHRGAALAERTKEMLLDASARIALDDMIGGEVAAAVNAIKDGERFPAARHSSSEPELVVELATRSDEYLALVEPFCASLQVAARWADPERLDPWVAGLRHLYSAGTAVQGGLVAASDLRTLPVVAAVHVAGVAATAAGEWANLRALLVDARVRSPASVGAGEAARLPLIEVVDPWVPFGNAEHVAHLLARRTGDETFDLNDLAAEVLAGRRRLIAPVSDWFRRRLRHLLVGQLGDSGDYDDAFDFAEAFLGMLNVDAKAQRSDRYLYTNWFGSAVWRSRYLQVSVVDELLKDVTSHGKQWMPLQAGLFGGDLSRAIRAGEKYKEAFDEQRRRR